MQKFRYYSIYHFCEQLCEIGRVSHVKTCFKQPFVVRNTTFPHWGKSQPAPVLSEHRWAIVGCWDVFCSLCRVASPMALHAHSFPSLVISVLALKTYTGAQMIDSASHDVRTETNGIYTICIPSGPLVVASLRLGCYSPGAFGFLNCIDSLVSVLSCVSPWNWSEIWVNFLTNIPCFTVPEIAKSEFEEKKNWKKTCIPSRTECKPILHTSSNVSQGHVTSQCYRRSENFAVKIISRLRPTVKI